jgi:two-component system sensor histidine kinase MprB
MSLRLRVTLFFVVVVAAAAVAISWAAYASAYHEARGKVDQALLSRVGVPGGPVGGPGPVVVAGAPPEEPYTQTGGITVRPDVLTQFVDASGTVYPQFAGSPTLPVDQEDLAIAASGGGPRLRDVVVDGVHYRMLTTQATRVISTAASDGPGQATEASLVALQVARDLTETDAFLASMRIRLLLIGGAAVIVAGLVAWLVSHRAVRPVTVLTKAAEHVAETRDLETPIEVGRRDEIGRLAGAFNTMLGALAWSRAQQRRLVADAGHELRTPLTSLRTNIEVLARASEMPAADRAELLADARHELEELSDLVGELLDLAADAPPEETVPMRLDDIVTEVVERFQRRTGRAVAVDAEATPVAGKPGRLARAVANLLDNAGKWAPPDTQVEVTLKRGRLEVRDHGPGFDPEDLPRVFERFYRSTKARTTAGSGLGLSIVEQVAEEHGGHAFAANADDGGAVVGFEVPLSEGEPIE